MPKKKLKSKEKIVKVYMCATDWEWEIGEVLGSTPVYSSVKSLKDERSCVEECGIVEVEVKLSQWIQPENRKWGKG